MPPGRPDRGWTRRGAVLLPPGTQAPSGTGSRHRERCGDRLSLQDGLTADLPAAVPVGRGRARAAAARPAGRPTGSAVRVAMPATRRTPQRALSGGRDPTECAQRSRRGGVAGAVVIEAAAQEVHPHRAGRQQGAAGRAEPEQSERQHGGAQEGGG